jgi:hypothetical protein
MISRIHFVTAEHACAMHLPHLVTNGFLFLTLFGGEHCVEIALCFDPHKTQLGFEGFSLFNLGFDDGQLRLLICHERPELPFRNLDICMSPDLSAVLVKSEDLELGDLVVRQAEILLMSQEVAKNV